MMNSTWRILSVSGLMACAVLTFFNAAGMMYPAAGGDGVSMDTILAAVLPHQATTAMVQRNATLTVVSKLVSVPGVGTVVVDDDKQAKTESELPPLLLEPQNDDIVWPFSSPDEVFIYLMHVGKAGGKSLYEALNVTAIKTRFLSLIDCRMRAHNISACPYNQAPFYLSRRLMGHFHLYKAGYTKEQSQWLDNHTNLLLFTVRDPIDRMVSAWNYHRHQSYDSVEPKPSKGTAVELFHRCFRTIEDVALSADLHNKTNLCAQRGAAVLRGEIAQPVVHFRYNYEYYTTFGWKMPQAKKKKYLAVVRTESMWSDLARLERLLGGDPSYFESLDLRKGNFSRESKSYAVKSGLSEQGTHKICCLAYFEFKRYHELILAAINLKPSEKRVEVQNVQRRCGMQPSEEFYDNVTKWNDWMERHCNEK